jgi:hypothetical protein
MSNQQINQSNQQVSMLAVEESLSKGNCWILNIEDTHNIHCLCTIDINEEGKVLCWSFSTLFEGIMQEVRYENDKEWVKYMNNEYMDLCNQGIGIIEIGSRDYARIDRGLFYGINLIDELFITTNEDILFCISDTDYINEQEWEASIEEAKYKGAAEQEKTINEIMKEYINKYNMELDYSSLVITRDLKKEDYYQTFSYTEEVSTDIYDYLTMYMEEDQNMLFYKLLSIGAVDENGKMISTNKRGTKITRIINKELEIDENIKKYILDTYGRVMFKINKIYEVEVSNRLDDIMMCSTEQCWKSCYNLVNGCYRNDCVKTYLTDGMIAYIKINGLRKGRVLIRKNNEGKYWLENRVYSDDSFDTDKFTNEVIKFLSNNNMYTSSSYTMNGFVGYSDTNGNMNRDEDNNDDYY